ncbi:MAG: mechanosensitive ion channel, partial [Rhodocyclaceae bacterium]|nr:mechanosensitive ion channel [Rhodocyclaceae bacterium]
SHITTRYTVLKGLNGVEVLVPNETLVSSVVQNETFTDTRMLLPVDVQVSYGSDLDLAMSIMVEEAARQPRVLKEPAPKAYLVNFADSGINLRVGMWLGDPREGSLGVISEINLAVWRRFREAGIEFPFPQREVRILSPLPAITGQVPAASA